MADTIIKLRIPEAKAEAVLALIERNFEREQGELGTAFIQRYFRNHLIELDYRDRRRQHTVVPDDGLIEDEP